MGTIQNLCLHINVMTVNDEPLHLGK